MSTTREPQYDRCLDVRDEVGLTPLGLMSNQTWYDDPRRLVFLLSRYKFVAKMLSGSRHVLEIGCADAFGSRILLQEVERLTAVDFDPVFVEDVRSRADSRWPIDCRVHDMLEGPVEGDFDAAFSLDVLEHIAPEQEQRFLRNTVDSLEGDGVALIGSPSIESQAWASPLSKAGHVNCKTQAQLKELLLHHFRHVFVFAMNDEVVHTGFPAMAHYLLALCCSRK
jgi:2-polyprenyl-3-methyl-5-hydroxy-6-metoxy-1,4-benzoquinol methylase